MLLCTVSYLCLTTLAVEIQVIGMEAQKHHHTQAIMDAVCHSQLSAVARVEGSTDGNWYLFSVGCRQP